MVTLVPDRESVLLITYHPVPLSPNRNPEDAGARLLCHFLAVPPWTGCLTSLSLSFLVYNTTIIILIVTYPIGLSS